MGTNTFLAHQGLGIKVLGNYRVKGLRFFCGLKAFWLLVGKRGVYRDILKVHNRNITPPQTENQLKAVEYSMDTGLIIAGVESIRIGQVLLRRM